MSKNLQQLRLRKLRYRKMQQNKQIPSSSQEKIIVPCLQRTLGFRTNQFIKYPQQLEQHIEQARFQKLVRDANQIIDGELLGKATKESAPYFYTVSIWIKISIIISMVGLAALGIIVYKDFENEAQKMISNVGFSLILIAMVMGAICPLYLHFKKYKQYNFETIIKQKLDRLADQQNDQLKRDGQSYLHWKFQECFFWIQLHINQQNILKQRKLLRRFVTDLPRQPKQ